jgi:hypothetical protein
MNVGISVALALVFGALIFVLGIVRNWTAATPDAGMFFGDLVAGASLMFGALTSRKNFHTGRRYLAAAWGFAAGLYYLSLATLLSPQTSIVVPQPDDGVEWTMVGTIIGLLISVIGVITSLKSTHGKQ